MKKIMIIKSREKENEVLEMEVEEYFDMGSYYDLKFKDGFGFISKERVIRIEIR